MVTKKDLIIAVLCTFCLTSTLFMMTRTTGSPDIGEYDPWIDLNDDGQIDLYDAVTLAGATGSFGTPINKTELLYNVNDTLAALLARIDNLNNSLTLKIEELELQLAIMNASKLGTPDYDSGWFNISNGGQVIKTHNLGTTNVLVFMVGKYSNSSSPYIHQRNYGGEETWPNYWGAYWQDLTETTIRVIRQGQDENWNYVRVMVWKIPEP